VTYCVCVGSECDHVERRRSVKHVNQCQHQRSSSSRDQHPARTTHRQHSRHPRHTRERSTLQAKFHYASWFGAGSESELVRSWFAPDSVMEFGFYQRPFTRRADTRISARSVNGSLVGKRPLQSSMTIKKLRKLTAAFLKHKISKKLTE